MRLRWLAGVYAVAALGACMQLPAAATAATYDVVVCKGGGGSGAAFETLDMALSSMTCPPAPGAAFSGLVAQDQLGAGDYPTGTRGGFTVTAPAGTTISQIIARRYFGKRPSSWQVAVRTAQGQILETCDFNPALATSCSQGSGIDPAQNTVTYAQLSTPNVEFGFTCNAAVPDACARNPSSHRVWMVIYDATVTIEDPAAPALGQASGGLLGPGGPGGWHQGTETVAVSASDASGIKRTGITIDTSRQWADQACDYTRTRPCPPSVVATHPVNLNAVADGRHQLRVGAADAAGQRARRGGPLLVRGQARVRRGRWRISARLPRALQGRRAALVTVRYRGDRRHAPQAITRRIGRR